MKGIRSKTRAFLILFTVVCASVPSQAGPATGTDGPRVGSGSSSSSSTAFSAALEDLRNLLKQGEYADAETKARKLLQAQEQTTPEDLKTRIEILDVLVQSLLRQEKWRKPETESLVKESVELSRRVYGNEDPVFAHALNSLARIYFSRSENDAARQTWEQVLSIRRKALGPDHPDVAAALNNLGLTYQQEGNYTEALRLLEQARVIREKALGPDHPDVATTLTNIGNQLVNLGDYQAAVEAQERALAIRERAFAPDHPLIAESLSNLGEAYLYFKDFKRARPLFERALAVDEKAFGSGNPYIASDKGNLGKLLQEVGDYAGALSQLEEVLAIDERRRGPENRAVARDLQDLSGLYAKLGRPAEAMAAAQRALAIQEKVLGAEHVETATALEMVANRYFEAGQYQKEVEVLGRALAIAEKGLGPAHPEIGEILQGLADAQVELGSLAEARQNYERALAIRKESFGPAHEKVGESLLQLGRLSWREGACEAAMDRSLASEGILRDQFIQVAPALSEREALAYEIARSSGISLAVSSLFGLAGEARGKVIPGVWDEIIRSRALVLDEMASRHAAFTTSTDPDVARKARTLSAARNRLARLVIDGPPEDDPSAYRKDLAAVLSEKEQAERELAASSTEFQRRSESRKGLQDVVSSLPKQAALVAYLAYDRLAAPTPTPAGKAAPPIRSYVAFLLRAGRTQPSVVDLGPANTIDRLVQEWRKEVAPAPSGIGGLASLREEQMAKAGTRLRKAVWDPLASQVKGARTVFVVFDGALNLVNLAALPSDDQRFVLETGPTFHYLGAERDLARRRQPSTAAGGLLALGGPDFDAGPAEARGKSGLPPVKAPSTYRSAPVTCAGFATMRFTPLAASAREAEAIESLWKGASNQRSSQTLVLTGSAATEAAMKQRAPEFRVLHVATHGYFLDDRCGSSLNAARGTPGASIPMTVAGENPLLLSGLVLAGANRRTDADAQDEDGVLTAEEIASLDLTGVDWAVLSACETGVGKIQLGEGVLGLRRAFEVAGAGSLIMSLWKVEDESTRTWMQSLYQGRLAGLSTAEAVRQAGLTMLKKRRALGKSSNPGAWGAFVAAGDWR
jgi:CHAT domain-containing protein/tetratricopeptide (TPR) repeat protein